LSDNGFKLQWLFTARIAWFRVHTVKLYGVGLPGTWFKLQWYRVHVAMSKEGRIARYRVHTVMVNND